jgi:hypothetical protein
MWDMETHGGRDLVQGTMPISTCRTQKTWKPVKLLLQHRRTSRLCAGTLCFVYASACAYPDGGVSWLSSVSQVKCCDSLTYITSLPFLSWYKIIIQVHTDSKHASSTAENSEWNKSTVGALNPVVTICTTCFNKQQLCILCLWVSYDSHCEQQLCP